LNTALQQKIIATALAMNAASINHNKSGNVSARGTLNGEAGLWITPTALPYAQLQPDDLPFIRLSDATAFGKNAPSSEWRFHVDIYHARPDVNAIVHCHSSFATTLACLQLEIPAFHYMVAAAGGNNIRCAPYATFGTQALSDGVVEALQARDACLMAQHGQIAVGKTLDKALVLAVEVEALAKMYWQVKQLAEPTLLSDDEMARVIDQFHELGYADRAR
jgi:L-fuculose-phosphate aldolase